MTCRRKSLVSSERSPLPGASSAPAGAPERACARESAWRVCLSGRPAGPQGRAAGPCPLSAPSAPAPAPAPEFHEFRRGPRPPGPPAGLAALRPATALCLWTFSQLSQSTIVRRADVS